MQSLEEGYYKIGISKNPSKRIEQLQTGNASELKLIAVYPTEIYSLIELTLKNRYTVARRRGEWFKLNLEDEQSFVNVCKKIEEDIMFLKRNGNVFI
jgi:hypothetical protein